MPSRTNVWVCLSQIFYVKHDKSWLLLHAQVLSLGLHFHLLCVFLQVQFHFFGVKQTSLQPDVCSRIL